MKTALLTCKTFPGSRLLAVDLPSQEELGVIGSPPEIPVSPSRVSPLSLHDSIQLVVWSWEVLGYIVSGRVMEMGVQL